MVSRDRGGSLVAPLALGLSLGLAAGFVLGEFLAGRSKRGIRGLLRDWRGRPSGRTPIDAAQLLERRLGESLGPDGQSVEILPVGHTAIEISGWVSSRGARSKTLRLAREAFGPDIRLVDSLLVWGEDDRTITRETDAESVESREPEPAQREPA